MSATQGGLMSATQGSQPFPSSRQRDSCRDYVREIKGSNMRSGETAHEMKSGSKKKKVYLYLYICIHTHVYKGV